MVQRVKRRAQVEFPKNKIDSLLKLVWNSCLNLCGIAWIYRWNMILKRGLVGKFDTGTDLFI